MLAVRSWTGYELTQQLRRSLRFVWPSSEGHLYREQRRLVDLGWATVEREQVAGRTRNRYRITPQGRTALRTWMRTEPEEPHFEIEGLLRLFYADLDTPGVLAGALRSTEASARSMLDDLAGFAREYLEDGGPLWMLDRGVGGPEDRREFRGRVMFPERIHAVALVLEATTALLMDLRDFAANTITEVESWDSTTDPALAAETRQRLERIVAGMAS
jgi:PadR family transcriptional regulator AphA